MANEDNEWIAWLNQVNGEEASTKNDADNPPQRLKVVSSAEKGDAEKVEEASTIEEEAPGESTPVDSWDDLFSANAPLSAPASSSASKKSAPWKRRSDSSGTASVAESSDARAPRVEDPHKGGVKRFWPLFAVVVVCALAATTYVGLALSSQFEGNRPESVGADAPSEVAATTTRVASSDLPKDDVTVVSAGCTPSKGEEVMPPSQKNVRSAYISLQQEYAARNADGVRALIAESNKELKDQDWKQALASLPDDYSYCMTMPPASGDTATAKIEMRMNGKDVVANQKITGTADAQGRWFIKKIESVKG